MLIVSRRFFLLGCRRVQDPYIVVTGPADRLENEVSIERAFSLAYSYSPFMGGAFME